MTVFVLVMLPVLLALGVWQLERAQEKRCYQTQYFDRIGGLPQPVPDDPAAAPFLRVRLEGRYSAQRHYLVDNRPRAGRPGYWVVTPFEAADGRTYLVNRGWLAAPGQRERLPAVPAAAGKVRITGVVWPDTGLPPLLAPDPWPDVWPRRVQRLDVARMARQGAGTVAAEIRLEPGQPGVLTPPPLDIAFAPERHQAYAAQWFGLAGVLAIGYLIFGFSRTREDDESTP